MTSVLILLAIALAAYLIGSVPFGYLIARARGVNIFEQGSGNVGATNVGRVLGRRFGIAVFVLDFLKGAIPVWLAVQPIAGVIDGLDSGLAGTVAGTGSILGHMFSVFLRFRGGKGVATGAGVVVVLVPGPALAALVSWVAILFLTGYVSAASIGAAWVLYFVRATLTPDPFSSGNGLVTAFCLMAASIVMAKHGSNVMRLVDGRESRIKGSFARPNLAKNAHLLALGLWFGAGVFFTFVAAPLIFQSFEGLVADHAGRRPVFLPGTLTKDQASQLAGLAVGPVFPWYFLLTGVCSLLAFSTQFETSSGAQQVPISRFKFMLLNIGFLLLVIGWPIALHVSALRVQRGAGDPVAREAFARWHLVSLALNIVTVGVSGTALALAANSGSGRKSVGVIHTKESKAADVLHEEETEVNKADR